MTRLFNEPDDFVDQMIDGFVVGNRSRVRKVRGGVARSTQVPPGEVALVIGGGSGHYPTFCGLVGQGIAHGAAMGNLFASPSAKQAISVAQHAHNGGGVLFSFGNYAGDVLHFGHAQEELNAAGIPTRTVLVTDDVYSAPIEQKEKRRGIAGDFTVFKVAGAAAAEGRDLDEVTRLAQKANDHTRSIGVAFSGCSLPGSDAPLFSVAEGRMAVGMGIHGEPGINETNVPSADELAEQLVEAVLRPEEWPDGVTTTRGARLAVILNGLGAVKYEELFVVYRRIDELLADHGLTVLDPEIGEFVTSFDMAGVSFTIMWLDDELEPLWNAPADTPAYRKGNTMAAPLRVDLSSSDTARSPAPTIPQASAASREVGEAIVRAISAGHDVIVENFDMLGHIDAVAGDGDHGIGMRRGLFAAHRAAQDALDRGAGAGTILRVAGDTWSDRAGGTSGAIWGAALEAAAAVIADDQAPGIQTISRAIRDVTDVVLGFGASVGDKTIVDALVPFCDVFTAAADDGITTEQAWQRATEVARAAADATAHLLPHIGRARPHAEKSLGTPDPGAVSFVLLAEAMSAAVSRCSPTTPDS